MNVGVGIRFGIDDIIIPTVLVMPNGEIRKIDQVIDVQLLADPLVGRRYQIRIDGRTMYLVYDGSWTLE